MIKFLDLQASNAVYAEELKQAACEVIDKGWFLLGDRVTQFEKDCSDYLKVKNTIACANGLDALRLILRAYMEMGLLKKGDEIIVPGNTFVASVLAITDNNLTAVLAPPIATTHNLDLDRLQESLTPRTRAVMVVHLYGQTCWEKQLEEFASKNNLLIIEDNAQAFGSKSSDGRYTGSLGNAAGNSFYPGKNLGSLGDAGAISTNDEELARVVRCLANYGSMVKYKYEFAGLNSRMDELQAAFLSVKLKYLDHENRRRREIATYYCNHITHPDVILPAIQQFDNSTISQHVWHLFVIRTSRRKELQEYLTQNNIQTQIHYPIPPHKQECYSGKSLVTGSPFVIHQETAKLTEQLAEEVLSLPISPVMTEDEVRKVVDLINAY